MSDIVLSEYARSLDNASRRRYEEKSRLVNNEDPYLWTWPRANARSVENEFPHVGYCDIVNYLVYQRSAYSEEDFKAYKSLLSYKQFVCGWVKDVLAKTFGDAVVVRAKVLHSQRLSKKPLEPWVMASSSGQVITAHCTCMTGLAESCSHVGALLFFIENAMRGKEELVVTEKTGWAIGLVCQQKKTVDFAKAAGIDFSATKYKGSTEVAGSNRPVEKSLPSCVLTAEERQKFVSDLNETLSERAILSVTTPFCFNKQESLPLLFPPDLGKLFNPTYQLMPVSDVKTIADNVDLSFSAEQAAILEEATRNQAKSKLWLQYRTGRVTAAVFKSACGTKLDKPSQSLVNKICYPFKSKFSREASYVGFGASPDSVIECSCHGKGCVEVKCPFCFKNKTKEEIQKLKSCLLMEGDKMSLKRDHPYIFQIQMQMFVARLEYCDFVVWLHVERVDPDSVFWNAEYPKAEKFFKNVILPELLPKIYSTRLSRGLRDASNEEAVRQETDTPNSPATPRTPELAAQEKPGSPVVCCSPRGMKWVVRDRRDPAATSAFGSAAAGYPTERRSVNAPLASRSEGLITVSPTSSRNFASARLGPWRYTRRRGRETQFSVRESSPCRRLHPGRRILDFYSPNKTRKWSFNVSPKK